MQELREELNHFIACIGKGEMKRNRELRKKVHLLQEKIDAYFGLEKNRERKKILRYLNPDELTKA